MSEEFIENLKNIYEKAIKKNLLNVALKAQEMIAKYNGYFSKNKKCNISELKPHELQNILDEIKKLLEQ